MPNMIVYLPADFEKNYDGTKRKEGWIYYPEFMERLADVCAEVLAEAYNVANDASLEAADSVVKFQEFSKYDRGVPDVLFFTFFGKEELSLSAKEAALKILKDRLDGFANAILAICGRGESGYVDYEFANVRTCGFRFRDYAIQYSWGLE